MARRLRAERAWPSSATSRWQRRAAKFGFTEVRIGFVPALVSAFLALQIGDKRSRDLLLTGRLFDAEEAYRLGLVNEIVAPEKLTERVQALADVLIANSPQSLKATKLLMAQQNKAWLDAAIAKRLKPTRHPGRRRIFAKASRRFLKSGSRCGGRNRNLSRSPAEAQPIRRSGVAEAFSATCLSRRSFDVGPESSCWMLIPRLAGKPSSTAASKTCSERDGEKTSQAGHRKSATRRA